MSEELNVFIEETTVPIVEMVIEETVSDAILYDQDEVVIDALAKYVEMLETDSVDEEFEENLSVLLFPYMENNATLFEMKNPARMGGKIGKVARKVTGAAKKVGQGYDATIKGIKGAAKATKEGVKGAAGKVADTASNLKFDAQFKGRALKTKVKSKTGRMLNRIRNKLGNKGLAGKIKAGYKKAKNFITDKAGRMKNAVSAGLNKARLKVGAKLQRLGADNVVAATAKS